MCVSCVHIYIFWLRWCVRQHRGWGSGGGAVQFREPLCPFIAEEWRLFTHAVGVRVLTSISSLWLVKMQFWTCSRLVNVWQGGRGGAELKTMIPLMNADDHLSSHFCHLMSAKRWNLARFNHKAILLLNKTLQAFRAGRWFLEGGGAYLQGSSTNLNVPVPKLSSPQREQRPESIRFPKYLHPVGVSYSASFMALATLKPHRKKETYTVRQQQMFWESWGMGSVLGKVTIPIGF